MTTTTKGLRLDISRPASGADYSLRGVSAAADHLVLIGWTGHDRIES